MEKRPLREVPECAEAHEHASALDLALDLDELDQSQMHELEQQLCACTGCLAGLEVLVFWLDALGHWDPRVGPEYVTRHRLMTEVLYVAERDRHGLGRIQLDETFHSWGLCRLLLDGSRQAVSMSSSYSFRLAGLAYTIAEALDGSFYSSDWVADLRAEAAAHLAVLNRQRGCGDEAGRLFRLAREYLASGTGRRELTRAIEVAESLLSSNRLLENTIPIPGSYTPSLQPTTDLPGIRRPVHRLLERCKAALVCR